MCLMIFQMVAPVVVSRRRIRSRDNGSRTSEYRGPTWRGRALSEVAEAASSPTGDRGTGGGTAGRPDAATGLARAVRVSPVLCCEPMPYRVPGA